MFTIIGADGKEYGPVTADLIKQWMAENRLTSAMQARRDGETAWRRIGEFPEFAAPAATAPGAEPPPVAAPDGFATTAPAIPGLPTEAGAPQPVVFTGKSDEYFKIWIVNVLLTIVTLGIYAAWAKVRKRRYFYANTRVLGHTFEYLADPVKILYGNLIIAALVLCLSFSQLVSPFLYLGLVLLFSIAAPWFIVRALAFNARNSAWRGLRFNFIGRYGGAAVAFLLWPLLVPFTLGILYPLVAKEQKQFVVGHHAFGTARFSFRSTTEQFYKLYGMVLLFFVPIMLAYFALTAALIAQMPRRLAEAAPAANDLAATGILFIAVAPLAFAGVQYLRARMFNLLWNSTTLAGTRFVATLRFRDLLLLEFVNKLVVVLTLGFMAPWAAVRTAQLRADSLQIVPWGDPESFVASEQSAVGAVGDSANDFFNFDIGFGG